MNNAKITVITPCLNRSITIRETLESVLRQTYQNYEYLIADGGSTDGTIQILKEYETAFGGKMVWHSQKDKGIANGWNKAAKKATGDLVVFLGSDDQLEETAFERIMEVYDPSKPLAVYYGMMRTIKDGRETGCVMVHHSELPERMICFPSSYITRAAAEKFGYMDERYKIASDYSLLLKLYVSGEVEFIPVYHILSRFSLGGISSRPSISPVEKAKIQYENGIITKKMCRKRVFKYYLKTFCKKVIPF